MSRNIRQKYQTTPVKASKKRRGSDSSSSLDLSDDDGYSGVEDVSDSDDDDDEHVFAAEEEHIISQSSRKRSLSTPRPVQDEDEDADEEEENDEEEEEAGDDEEEEADEDAGADETTSWDGILSDPDDNTAAEQLDNYIQEQEVVPVERHVRFAGVPDSDSDSDSTTTDASEDIQSFFPDIFIDQNQLDPAFRREIENDDESSGSGSFWDFHSSSQDFLGIDSADDAGSDEETPTATPVASQPPTEASTPVASDEVQELDGYETDGETTEEDIPTEPPVRKKQVRRVQPVDMTSDSDTERPVRSRRGNKPRVGRYNLDSSVHKPIAVVNPTTRKMMIFTPSKMSRLDLSPESFNVDLNADLCSPILSNPGLVMMGAMFSSNTFGDFMNTQPFGPAEAFFPLTSDTVVGVDSEDSEIDVPAQADEEESMLKLEDFIYFNHEDSEGEEELGFDWNGDITSSPARPKTSASAASAASDASMFDVHPLLSHFDNNSDAVGAFRRNQINQQLILSEKASQESLAFSGPLYHGTLRGIKTGSMEAVTTPITPARRHKRPPSMGGMNGYSDLQSSPLNSVSQKRKASSGLNDNTHKRHRSISDMEVLQI
ncbi:hypothetical protein QBC46DRAFT_130419 [Diplogelasinospora grovesii]|uniref:Uncharacterized protein n=1 Tax=Diplogelasinospora grovesii TaxID=303347 RepID=A0AAN6S3W2_9PEZI|nr:hypothetical protein QBC46DRAFT_130419 [Diplogelasinospora grovesii]